MPTHKQTLAMMILGSLIVTAVALPMPAMAAGETKLELMPHCTETDRTKCPSFTVLDAERLTTARLKAGELLDLDIVLKAGTPSEVREVRSWLSYDPKVLESRSVELTSVITSPTPGEQEADQAKGLVKIGGSMNGVAGTDVVVARVTFRVISAAANTTVAFHQYFPTGGGYTAVNGELHTAAGADEFDLTLKPAPCFDELVGCGEVTSRTPLLSLRPASLVVSLADASMASSISSSVNSSSVGTPVYGNRPDTLSTVTAAAQSSTAGTTAVSSSADARFNEAPSPFSLLQVQGVQVTTRQTSVYLGWQALKSSELAGYNIYYGTVSGRYIQRRSVPPTAVSAVLRDFEPDATYYLAIRAFNQRNEESMFSNEVAVTVGKPETATVPFLGSGVSTGENIVSNNGGSTVSGETGTATTLTWMLLASALIGTAFAFRRQFSLLHVA